ncbi:hypothetical protein PAEPH01_2910 [Pancytospora epiphaga]|nr:hypothetical protein PAEPH01_2910 [Pancytospora epiphaga]
MRCKPKIIPYVMTWYGVVTSYHKQYLKEIGLTDFIKAYIQTMILKKMLKSIFCDRKRGSAQGEMQKPRLP